MHSLRVLLREVVSLDPMVWVYAILLGLAFAFSVYALVRNRGLAGLIAMWLASLAAGAGATRQVGTESAIDRDLRRPGNSRSPSISCTTLRPVS